MLFSRLRLEPAIIATRYASFACALDRLVVSHLSVILWVMISVDNSSCDLLVTRTPLFLSRLVDSTSLQGNTVFGWSTSSDAWLNFPGLKSRRRESSRKAFTTQRRRMHSHFFRVIEDASNSMRNEECIEFGGILLRNRKTPSSKTYQLTFVDPFDALVEDGRFEIKDSDAIGIEHGTSGSQSDTHPLRQSRRTVMPSQSYGIRR
ncbi:hypothetical protein DAPPUDRAFT_117669 [Daphnia pulex]|uniref:Uncharacterized protein n=1 Tax=Daphnia pulex TaxID=6669 RepID=E9HTF1_DAPPU|nr:hypothetical protein DAPPUDRAFT_117669 [Daphnia pulex]|eukprot:EFX64966.1 hypothetical protein DAPPUDRAFT_117669 [Daphnia pulex]